ncbi:hypothetical protein CPB86DRAFT_807805 [Serendipita vermifera]|nr:hypothetical protein CPB86DRAFT_807805 [Serendipita vermifera]
MSSSSPVSSSYIVTDTPPPSSSSSPDGGADEPTITISISIPTSSSSMDGDADDTSSSSTVIVSPTDPPPSSSTYSSSSSSSTPPSSPPSSSSSSSASDPDGGGDGVSSTSISGSSSSLSRPSGSSSTPGSSSSSSSGQDQTVNEEPTVTPTRSRQEDDPAPTVEPVSTVPTAISFTTTNSEGDTVITIPTQFTTVVVSTVPGGTFTTITEVVANPPGALNPGGNDSGSASAFFKNRGTVAGVFIAAALALCAIVLFALFAVRRRRTKIRNDRDAEIAAGLAAAAATNNRFTDDDDHPVVMRSVPSALRGRSPWLDEEDEDRLIYDAAIASNAPILYSNLPVNNNAIGRPLTQQMPIDRGGYYPASPVPYALARSTESSPSPKKEPATLPSGPGPDPSTSSNQVPRTNSGWSSAYGGIGLFSGRKSVSPVPTTNAGHAPPTSASHAPSSYYNHRPPPSFAHESGSNSGSGGTSSSVAGGFGARRSSPNVSAHDSLSGSRKDSPPPAPGLDGMYPPEYELYAGSGDERVASAAGRYSVVDPDIGYAYEPEPVQHNRTITAGLPFVQGFDYTSSSNLHQSNTGVRARVQSTGSTVSRSLYSQEGSGEWEEHGRDGHGEDPRLDPLMRMRGGLRSELSMGPRDHEDYMRRVQAQPLTSPSTASHSHSLSRTHSTH